MKKIKVCLVIAGLIILAFLVCGCQEQVKEPTPARFDAFVRLNARQHLKIGQSIITLHERIKKLEGAFDPND